MRRRSPIERQGTSGGLPDHLAAFDPADWPSDTDRTLNPGTAYGESLRHWQAAWDRWQGCSTRAQAVRLEAENEAWRCFPDDPFDPEGI